MKMNTALKCIYLTLQNDGAVNSQPYEHLLMCMLSLQQERTFYNCACSGGSTEDGEKLYSKVFRNHRQATALRDSSSGKYNRPH